MLQFWAFSTELSASGSKRFGRLWLAARDNAPAPPLDTRYLSRPFAGVGAHGNSQIRGDVATFLECLYESVAETLPDFKDELGSAKDIVIPLADDPAAAELEAHAQSSNKKRSAEESLADVDLQPRKKFYTRSRQVKVNPERTGGRFEERWLPPAAMMEYYEQYRSQSGLEKAGSFKSFWRVARFTFRLHKWGQCSKQTRSHLSIRFCARFFQFHRH